jgi:hypothetical protein
VTIDLLLVRPHDGRVLWTHRYERPAREVLALGADVVRGLSAATRITLRSPARERLTSIRAVSPDVYEAYLKGRYEWNKRTEESLERGVEHFTRAVELDPTYAPAHAALADCFSLLGTVMLGAGSPRDFRPRAAAAAIRHCRSIRTRRRRTRRSATCGITSGAGPTPSANFGAPSS